MLKLTGWLNCQDLPINAQGSLFFLMNGKIPSIWLPNITTKEFPQKPNASFCSQPMDTARQAFLSGFPDLNTGWKVEKKDCGKKSINQKHHRGASQRADYWARNVWSTHHRNTCYCWTMERGKTQLPSTQWKQIARAHMGWSLALTYAQSKRQELRGTHTHICLVPMTVPAAAEYLGRYMVRTEQLVV